MDTGRGGYGPPVLVSSLRCFTGSGVTDARATQRQKKAARNPGPMRASQLLARAPHTCILVSAGRRRQQRVLRRAVHAPIVLRAAVRWRAFVRGVGRPHLTQHFAERVCVTERLRPEGQVADGCERVGLPPGHTMARRGTAWCDRRSIGTVWWCARSSGVVCIAPSGSGRAGAPRAERAGGTGLGALQRLGAAAGRALARNESSGSIERRVAISMNSSHTPFSWRNAQHTTHNARARTRTHTRTHARTHTRTHEVRHCTSFVVRTCFSRDLFELVFASTTCGTPSTASSNSGFE